MARKPTTTSTGSTMTGAQFKTALAKIGMSQGAASRFLGIARRTATNYASDETPIPTVTAKLLRFMVRAKVTADDPRFNA
jgi:hypothetical protein